MLLCSGIFGVGSAVFLYHGENSVSAVRAVPCMNPYEAMAQLVDILYKKHGDKGLRAYDEFAKTVARNGPGRYTVIDVKVEVKENEVCIEV